MSAVIVCDLCGAELSGVATQLRLTRSKVGLHQHGKPYLAPREDLAESRIVCRECAAWVDQAIDWLKSSLRAA